jgi:hypothetical protein
MKSDLAILLGLIGLFVASLLLCGQRDLQLTAQNNRIALLEEQIGHGNIPRIEISKGTVYAGSGSITIEKIENEKTD